MNLEAARKEFLLADENVFFNHANIVVPPDFAWNTKMQPPNGCTPAARRLVDSVREVCAALLRTSSDRIVMTHNATEGAGFASDMLSLKPEDEIIVTSNAYGSVIRPFRIETWYRHDHFLLFNPHLEFAKEYYERNIRGTKMVEIAPDKSDSQLVRDIKNGITEKTKLVMVDHVFRQDGRVLPVKAVVDAVHKKGVPVLVDGAQAVGNLEKVEVEKIECDFYITSGHKFLLGDTASGIFYMHPKYFEDVVKLGNKARVNQLPEELEDKVYQEIARVLEEGDGKVRELERLKRDFCEREAFWLAPIASLGMTLEFLREIGDTQRVEHAEKLREKLKGMLEAEGYEVIDPKNHSPAILSFHISGATRIAEELKKKKVYVTDIDDNTIRLSFHVNNNEEDLDKFMSALKEVG